MNGVKKTTKKVIKHKQIFSTMKFPEDKEKAIP